MASPAMPEIGSVVGPLMPTAWAQVLVSPEFYGVIEVEDKEGEAMRTGVGILTQLTRAKTSLLRDPTTIDALFEDSSKIATILLCIPDGDAIHLVLRGEGRVYLRRGEQLSMLMDQAGSISGEVREGDMVLLATKQFAPALSDSKFTNIFQEDDPSLVAEKLTGLIHENNRAQGGAALIFRSSLVQEPAQEPVATFAQADSVPSEKSQTPRLVQNVFLHLGSIRSFLESRWSNKMGELPRKKQLGIVLTIGVIVFFLISVGIGIARQREGKQHEQVTKVLAEARHAFEEGNALMELNPAKAKERLLLAQELLTPLVDTIPPKSPDGRDIAELFSQVTEALTLSKNSIAGEPQLFYETSLLKEGSTIGSIALYENNVALLDRTNRTVFRLDIASKNGQILGGGENFTGATLVATGGDSVFVLTPNGIHKVGVGDKKTVANVVTKATEWNSIGGMTAYGGNIYLVDTGASRIWKYVATESGFSSLGEYLNPDTFVDLAGATSLAIDGSVWVGTAHGDILRFVQGKAQTFVPQDIEPPLTGSVVVYTSDEETNLYVLESQNKRVVVLDKDGIYIGQYVWEADIRPTQMVVSENDRKILLLDSGKLYSLDIK